MGKNWLISVLSSLPSSLGCSLGFSFVAHLLLELVGPLDLIDSVSESILVVGAIFISACKYLCWSHALVLFMCEYVFHKKTLCTRSLPLGFPMEVCCRPRMDFSVLQQCLHFHCASAFHFLMLFTNCLQTREKESLPIIIRKLGVTSKGFLYRHLGWNGAIHDLFPEQILGSAPYVAITCFLLGWHLSYNHFQSRNSEYSEIDPFLVSLYQYRRCRKKNNSSKSAVVSVQNTCCVRATFDKNVGNMDARVCPHHAGPRDFWRKIYKIYNDITFMDQKLLVSFPTASNLANLRLLGMKREAFDP